MWDPCLSASRKFLCTDKNYGSSQALGSMPRPPSATMSAAADRKVIEELSRESLDIMDDPCQGTQIRNLHQTKVHSSADAIAILLAGTRIRATAATVQNDVSSRSHTVFTVTTLITSSSSSEPDLTGELCCLCCIRLPVGQASEVKDRHVNIQQCCADAPNVM